MAGKEKIFVFDLDGTLADTAPALLNVGNEVLRSIGRNTKFRQSCMAI